MYEDEIWKDIPGKEGQYQVSSLGRVRSLDRFVSRGKDKLFCAGKILNPSKRNGYFCVRLGGGRNSKTSEVHRIVALTFIGEIPENYHVCHNNGIPTDNRVENLRIDTQSSNQLDSVDNHNTHSFSSRTHCPQGHEYSGDNLRWSPNKTNGRMRRVCVQCGRDKVKRHREKKKAEKLKNESD